MKFIKVLLFVVSFSFFISCYNDCDKLIDLKCGTIFYKKDFHDVTLVEDWGTGRKYKVWDSNYNGLDRASKRYYITVDTADKILSIWTY